MPRSATVTVTQPCTAGAERTSICGTAPSCVYFAELPTRLSMTWAMSARSARTRSGASTTTRGTRPPVASAALTRASAISRPTSSTAKSETLSSPSRATL